MIKTKSKYFLRERADYFKGICEKLASLKSAKEVNDFLSSLLTKNEIDRIARRLGVAKRLMGKSSYTKISTDLLVGSDTISRVNKWLKDGIYNVERKGKEKKVYREISDEFPSSGWIRKRYPWHFILSEILKSKDEN